MLARALGVGDRPALLALGNLRRGAAASPPAKFLNSANENYPTVVLGAQAAVTLQVFTVSGRIRVLLGGTWFTGIEVVSIDPSEAYRHAIWAALPDARIVCDRFHLVRGANTALDAVRRERQRDAKAKRPKGARRSGQHVRWRPELYHARHRLLKASERLTGRERRRLCELFARDPILAEAWGLKETFRAIYRATSRTDAQQRLDTFLLAVNRAGLPAFDAFAQGIRSWQEELLAYFDEPTTNGYAQGVINKVKVIKRRAYGLPTFNDFASASS